MSAKKKKSGAMFTWQRSFSILAPWKKGKGNVVLDSEVVLTKMKLFNNFHERLLMADDTTSTISTASVSEQDISEPARVSVNPDPGLDPVSRHDSAAARASSSDYLCGIFSDSQLPPRLYKFESEDSGVELPSGANSPSTPTGSEQSFVVHSREPSCDSCHLCPPPADTIPAADALLRSPPQDSENNEAEEQSPGGAGETRDAMLAVACEELNFFIERDDLQDTGLLPERCRRGRLDADGNHEDREQATEEEEEKEEEEEEEGSEMELPENARPRSRCCTGTRAVEGATGPSEEPPLRKSTTSDSLEEYMEECCRLSEVQQACSSPLGSGLGYLEHICQLIEKIGQLQETNLRLQRQICGHQRDRGVAETKEDFFLQHCNCGAAHLAFQDTQKTHSRKEFLSPSGTMSDLTTIPEIARHSFSTRKDDGSGGANPCQSLAPGAPHGGWRGANRRSFTEGDTRSVCDSGDGLSAPQRRGSESQAWGRVKDLVRRSKLRSHSRLGLTSSSLKMSCPQLYRPDLGPVGLPGINRNSMIALGHQNKLDIPWLE